MSKPYDDTIDVPSSRREEQLAALVEQLLAQARAGAQPDIDALVAEHPQLGPELRELWAIAAMAEEFGSQSDGDPNVTDAIVDPTQSPLRFDKPASNFEDFELLEEIGRGGMGVVYRARQKSLGRIVALKLVLSGAAATQVDLTRFRSEAQTAARLRHPNIVQVFEVGQRNGLPFFTMQFVAGQTLASRLTEGPLPSRQAAAWLAPLARAIAEAHRQGILHRDLKPSNILIDEEGRPYVSDFGLAKRLPESIHIAGSIGQPASIDHDAHARANVTQTGAILGTPGYMSPEQAAGNRGSLSVSSDVYSLGAILYAMLTGHPPFQSASPLETVMMVLEQEVVAPRVLNPGVDRDLEMIAMKCLQKPVELRYASADALAADLEAYLANEPISARSSHIGQLVTRAFRETHHANILENWGLLWILHSVVLMTLCLITNGMQLSGITSRWPYFTLWIVGLGTWAIVFMMLRRRAGPITFVERQIAHVWAGSMVADTLLYAIEWQLSLPVLTLSPVLALVGGMVFLVKASMLSGIFYIHAAALFATAVLMTWLETQTYMPNLGLTAFGVVSSLCFFLPGWKYYQQVRRQR